MPRHAAATYALKRLSRATDPVSMIVRALRTDRPLSDALETWAPPSWSAQELAVVRASPEAEQVARRYIRLVLVESRIWEGKAALLEFLSSLRWSLHEDFTSAALESLARGRSHNDLLWQGALSAPSPPYERLLKGALDAYAEVNRWFDTTGLAEQRKAEEGELDAAYSSHVLEEPQDRFYAPESAIKQIVASRREREGFDWLRQHPRRSDLLDAWAESIPAASGDACREELSAFVESCTPDARRPAWDAIGRAQCRVLTDRVLQAIAVGPVAELDDCLSSLFGTYTPEEMRTVLGPAMCALPWPRRAALAFAARNARIPDPGDHLARDHDAHRDVLRELLDAPEREALAACSVAEARTGRVEGQDLEEAVWTRLLELTNGEDERLAALACVVMAQNGRLIGGVESRLLTSRGKWTRLHALRALRSADPMSRASVREFLSDEYYQCRRFAMWSLAGDASPDERIAILSMDSDRSAPVRKACADIIAKYRWEDGLGILCSLLQDRRDRNENSAYGDSTPDYHVARAAANALKCFAPPLPESVKSTLLDFLGRGSQASDDPRIHQALIEVVARERAPEVPPLLQAYLESRWRTDPIEFDKQTVKKQRETETTWRFPLRYAAAWGWLSHVCCYSDEASLLSTDVLAEAAGHSDDHLAAPALLAIGFTWQQNRRHIEQLLKDDLMTEERAVLLEMGARLCRAALPNDLLGSKLSPAHPGRRLTGWCFDDASEAEAWKQRLDADIEVQGWLDRIRRSTPIHAALRRVILKSPRGTLVEGLSANDFRQGEVAKGIPIMGMFTFASVE